MPENCNPITLGLTAAILAVKASEAKVLLVGHQPQGLPYGSFSPNRDRTLELGLRSWVDEQAGLKLGYVEQLYTFGNRHRDPRSASSGERIVTVGYLALVGQDTEPKNPGAKWGDWYTFLPWEDHRKGKPPLVEAIIIPQLYLWAEETSDPQELNLRKERIVLTFGNEHFPWDNERVLARYELLYEAGLVEESHRDWNSYPEAERTALPITRKAMSETTLRVLASSLGQPLDQDHRRILASTIGRLRGKLRYRPVIFELLPETFTLLQIQRVVEALSGVTLHKQNFRRLLLQGGLVKETPEMDNSQPGRPAALFRFRRSVLLERPAPGVGLPQIR